MGLLPRGMGKSFLIAIFVVIRCILYPGTKVVITSGTRGQSINVLEKIQTELMPVSPNLRNEIDMGDTKFSGQDAKNNVQELQLYQGRYSFR